MSKMGQEPNLKCSDRNGGLPMSSPGATAVAKRKSRNPDDWKAKPIIVQLRGATEFKEAVERLAEFDGSQSVSALVDRALRQYARQIGFNETLPKR